MGKMGPQNSMEEDLRSLPFAGLPFSYEGRFSALFAEENEKNLNKQGGWRREIDQISDDSFRGLFPFPLIARYRIVPLVAVLVVALLGSLALVKF